MYLRRWVVSGIFLTAACQSGMIPAQEPSPMFTLERKSIEVLSAGQPTFTAVFGVKVKTGEKEVLLGEPSSSTPAFQFSVWKDDKRLSTPIAVSDYGSRLPSVGGDKFRIPKNTSLTLIVTVVFQGSQLGAGNYAVSLDKVTWFSDGLLQSEAMNIIDPKLWRTSDVTLR